MKKIKFQITGECDLKCAFCSDAVSYQKSAKLEEIKEMIDHLIQAGIEEIQITGGEPLLYPNLKEVLRYLKQQNIKVTLSTNGLLLEEKKEIIQFLDEIILPVDASSSETLSQMGREPNQIYHTAKNIQIIKEENSLIKITVSTVLNRQNMNELKEIVMVLELLPIEEWQIHQFLPQGRGRRYIRKFLLDDREFEIKIADLQETNFKEKIVPIPVSQKIENEWSITPNLKLIKLTDLQPVFYGKILELEDSTLRNMFQVKEKTLKKS